MNNFIRDHLNVIKDRNFPNPELELRTLLNNCLLNNDVVFLNNFNINKINIQKFKFAFQRRLNHEPLSKIFNKKEFWSLNFYVNQCVLDPRPETEFIIESVQKYFSDSIQDFELLQNISGVDRISTWEIAVKIGKNPD